MDLPIEIINMILLYAQFEKLNEFLYLRLISQRWSDGVENFCSQKKSLFLNGGRGTLEKYAITTSQRFFGAVNVKSCLQIEIKQITSFNHNLTRLIVKLFPNVDLLIFGVKLDPSTAINFIFLTSHWKNISTLSLEKYVDPHRQILIASAINRLEKLIRLDLPLNFNTSLLLVTLRRIEHLSLGFNATNHELRNIIRQIGPNCSRLWILNKDAIITPEELNTWKKVNDDGLCHHLTHFGCCLHYKNGVEIIGAHFPSLHTVYVCDSYISWTNMGDISTLRELRVLEGSVSIFSSLVPPDDISKPMVNIHTFEFRSVGIENKFVAEDIETFCTGLDRLLPNVKHLILVFHELSTVEMFKQNLSMFKNLCTHEVKQWSQIDE